MTDYSELVKALRECGERAFCNDCPIFDTCDGDIDRAMRDAAAAIEALQAAEPTERQVVDYCHKRCLVVIGADLFHELKASYGKTPKRGEWIIDGAFTYNLRELNGKAYEPVYRCSCCNRQMESYLRLDEPKMPEDADFPEYCPHCGAKMTEVQE